MNNYNTAICIVGICLVITALVILINHLRTKKTIDTIENMLNAMKWAGVNHTEGVMLDDNGNVVQKGDCGPYIQSERLDIYKKYI